MNSKIKIRGYVAAATASLGLLVLLLTTAATCERTPQDTSWGVVIEHYREGDEPGPHWKKSQWCIKFKNKWGKKGYTCSDNKQIWTDYPIGSNYKK